MPCNELVELENTWKKRFDRANAESTGMFAVAASKPSLTLNVRQLRARQAQAALAILMHQRQCAACGNESAEQPLLWTDSRAS